MIENTSSRRYLNGHYAADNPDWDILDSPWKAGMVARLLERHQIRPKYVADVGCGAGGVISTLRPIYPEAEFVGYDIAPELANLWQAHEGIGIRFVQGDFLELNRRRQDLILILDVLEHLGDPFVFLTQLRSHAEWFIFHFPLDLSALSVLRQTPLIYARTKTGHLHYFTKGLAIALLAECGYEVVEALYTGAAFSIPRRTWKTRLAGIARRLAYAASKDIGVRFLGGETLLVLACSKGAWRC